MKRSLLATLFGSLLVLAACQANVTGDVNTDNTDDAMMDDSEASSEAMMESESSSSEDQDDAMMEGGATASVGVGE